MEDIQFSATDIFEEAPPGVIGRKEISVLGVESLRVKKEILESNSDISSLLLCSNTFI